MLTAVCNVHVVDGGLESPVARVETLREPEVVRHVVAWVVIEKWQRPDDCEALDPKIGAIEGDFGVPLARLKVAIMGAGGGVGQAIATQCVLLGVEKLVLVNRSFGKLRPLVDRLHAIGRTPEIVALAFGDESLVAQLAGCDLIVNASSIGLHPGDEMLLPAACLQPRHCVYDTIYQPPVTPLLLVAGGLGCRTANGYSMLLHQGALAFQHWFPAIRPLDVMREALAQRV